MTNKCYQKHNERLRKEERIKHQNLSEEEKDKRRKKVQERHQNLLEVEKEKSVSIIVNVTKICLRDKTK